MPTEIGRVEVRTLVEKCGQLVDVLSTEDYADSHLAGAINIPLDTLDQEIAARLRKDQPVILYCSDYQ